MCPADVHRAQFGPHAGAHVTFHQGPEWRPSPWHLFPHRPGWSSEARGLRPPAHPPRPAHFAETAELRHEVLVASAYEMAMSGEG